MSELVRMLEYSEKLCSEKLKKLIDPLAVTFGIKYFYYHQIHNDGAFFSITNNTDINVNWMCMDNLKGIPYFNHPKTMKEGLSLAETQTTKEMYLGLDYAKRKYKAGKMLVLINKYEGYCESIAFGTHINQNDAYSRYLSGMHLLKQFTEYFTENTKQFVKKLLDRPVDLYQEIREFDKPEHAMVDIIDQEMEKQFLESIDELGHTSIHLTKREKECIRLFELRKTAKETARLLNISPRTVEYYFENIKSKLGCDKKRDILNLLS